MCAASAPRPPGSHRRLRRRKSCEVSSFPRALGTAAAHPLDPCSAQAQHLRSAQGNARRRRQSRPFLPFFPKLTSRAGNRRWWRTGTGERPLRSHAPPARPQRTPSVRTGPLHCSPFSAQLAHLPLFSRNYSPPRSLATYSLTPTRPSPRSRHSRSPLCCKKRCDHSSVARQRADRNATVCVQQAAVHRRQESHPRHCQHSRLEQNRLEQRFSSCSQFVFHSSSNG